jgi:hypothetical protein
LVLFKELGNFLIDFIFSPKLGMVIVKKRGSARFFARDPRNNHQLINPPPGTIIDHTVTNQGIALKFSIT